MNRKDFLKTSAGFAAFSLMPGIWKVNFPKQKARKYKFQKYTLKKTLAPVTRVTPDDGFYIHTYFDVTPFSPSQKYLVTSKLPYQDKWPQPGDTADVCVIDLEEETIRPVYSTKCWEFQTGTNAQWSVSDRYVFTNDIINNKAVCIRIDIETGETKAFAGPMYNVAPDESCVVAFPLELMDVTQLGYGRPSKDPNNPPKLPPGASKTQGIWKTNLSTNKKSLLVSIADVAEKVPKTPSQKDTTYYFWHTKFNKQGTRIYSVFRCIMPTGFGARNPLVFTYNTDGTNIRYTTPMFPTWNQGGGHPNWHPNGDYIIRHLNMDDGVSRFCQIKYDGSEFILLSQKIKATGHPSIEPRGRFLITDTFGKENGHHTVSLRLIDVKADNEEIVCTIPTMPRGFKNELKESFRLDGHPVWSRDYKKLSLQAAEDFKRALYLVDLTKLIS